MASPVTLGESGTVYITHAAAVAYARWLQQLRGTDPGVEEARRRLTELLADARRVRSDPTGPTGLEHWRRRSRTDKVDLTAHVAREGTLAKVVSLHVRPNGPQRSERPNHGYRRRD